MAIEVDFSRLKTSWTKYDIVQVMEVIHSVDTIEKFKRKEAGIDEPILRSFLGIKSLDDPTPNYWIEIQKYPEEKKLFALFATLFTHGEIVGEFASKYATGEMKGIFALEPGKQYTNIRSALIEAGAAEPIYRRQSEVPYDFTPIFQNPDVGKLFKQVLLERISRVTTQNLNDSEFYTICFANHFHTALSVSREKFQSWLEGSVEAENHFIKAAEIFNFFSIDQVALHFNNAQEIYFLGENGDGKSLILMGLYLAFNGNYVTDHTDLEKTGKVADILRSAKNLRLSGNDERDREYGNQKSLFLKNFFAYGTHRGRYSSDNPEEYGFMSLFDSNQTLVNPVSWLKDQLLIELERNLDAQNMFPEEKTLPNSPPIPILQKMFYELLEKNVEIKIDSTGVSFVEKGTQLNFDQLSEGYKSILIFVTDLLYRLIKNAKDGEDVTHSKAIVLVDEIDLHLHPKWQQVIIKRLRSFFPNIQFIFTTHSPTIIQGASDDAILYRVYRNKDDGKTRVSEAYHRKELDHLMINTLITSPLFGLTDSRLNTEDDGSDTSETYLLYRINNKLKEELQKQKENGKAFIDDQAIDDLIAGLIKDEINDQNK